MIFLVARDKTEDNPLPSKNHLAAARRFVTLHGKPAKAVVEDLGRAGARVVLVGADGALGDVVVASHGQGEALSSDTEGLEAAVWDSSTVNAVKIGPLHRRRMAVLGTPKKL